MLQHAYAWWPLVALVAIASVTDLASRRIPNWLSLPFLAAGLVVPGYLNGWHCALESLQGALLGTVLTGVLYYMRGMGMGDVKLCAAVGAWVGPSQLFFALVVTALAGGLMAIVWALAGGFTSELFKGSTDLIFGFHRRGMAPHPRLNLEHPLARKMPYAPAIALGTLISFFAHSAR
jgi:prepilin peptidase CpaA